MCEPKTSSKCEIISPTLCVCSVSVSSLCLCSQDTAAENEIIVLDEMSGVQSEGRGWPVEVLVLALDDRVKNKLNTPSAVSQSKGSGMY